MKYPLFGIIYNWKGLKEENYLYTAEELQQFDTELYERCMRAPDAWHDSDKIECAWKTWMGTMIYSEERLRHFLQGTYNDVFIEEEDDGWYWENVKDNDLYGCKSNTMLEALSEMKGE